MKTVKNKHFILCFEKFRYFAFELGEYYVASFCRSVNLFESWRSYSNDGKGFAIGFKPDFFKAAEKKSENEPACTRTKVFYGTLGNDSALSDDEPFTLQIRHIANLVLSDAETGDFEPELLEALIASAMIPYCIALKHGCFSSEQEHRIYSFSSPENLIQKFYSDGSDPLA